MKNFGLGTECWCSVEQYPIPTSAQTLMDLAKAAKVKHLCPIPAQVCRYRGKNAPNGAYYCAKGLNHRPIPLREAAHPFDLELWKSANSPKA
jgi:hypothetical protein